MGAQDFVYMGGGGAGQATGSIVNAVRISGNTSGTTASISSGTMVLAGGNNITLSQVGNSITFSGANQTNATLSFFAPFFGSGTNRQVGLSSVHFDNMPIPAYVSITRADFMLSNSVSTSSNSSFAIALSLDIGFYTRSGSTLSLATSSATNYQVSDTGGASSSIISGIQLVSVPIAANLTPGNYWFAVLSRTASTNANWMTMSQYQYVAPLPLGTFGVTSAATNNSLLGNGVFSAQTAALPNSLTFGDIRGNANAFCNHMIVGFCNFTV